ASCRAFSAPDALSADASADPAAACACSWAVLAAFSAAAASSLTACKNCWYTSGVGSLGVSPDLYPVFSTDTTAILAVCRSPQKAETSTLPGCCSTSHGTVHSLLSSSSWV